MTEDRTIPDAGNTASRQLGNVIKIDDERIKGHLDRVVRGTVEETLNALLEAEADRLCNQHSPQFISFIDNYSKIFFR